MADKLHLALHLSDGTTVELPRPPDLTEFTLAGNGKQYAEFLAFHDDSTQTSALYYFAAQTWHLQQPSARELFWERCQALANMSEAVLGGASPSWSVSIHGDEKA